MQISENLIDRLQKSKHIVVLTGAGVSAESGISTFRDPDGLWAKFNPMELASVDGFMGNPELVWEWHQYRVKLVNESKPNPGHFAIAEMQKKFPKVTVVTQNVDRLHHAAGAEDIIELHGNIVTNRCFSCGEDFHKETALDNQELPKCDKCGGRIRSNVVWFGEMLPQDAIRMAELCSQDCDLFFSVGTSSEVFPANNLPVIAQQNGAYVVEVNPNETILSPYVDECIRELSGVAMPEILQVGINN